MLQIISSRCDILGLEFKPKKVFSDYELSIMNAFRLVFNIQPYGCWFHFTQAIFKNVKKHGLSRFYKTPRFARLVRMLFNLPLIPANLIKSYFSIISKEIKELNLNGQVSPFLNYIYKTWISDKARYPISVWCHYKDNFRSNCCIEG